MGWEKRYSAAAVVASACLALSGSPAAAIAHEAGAAALQEAVQASGELPKTVEYQKVTGGIESGATYALVTSNGNPKRILHYSNGDNKLDKCRSKSVEATLAPIDCEVSKYAGTGAHQWTITSVEGGYTVKSNTESGRYLNLSEHAVVPGDGQQVLKIEKTGSDTFAIGFEQGDKTHYAAFNDAGAGSWVISETRFDFMLYKKVEKTPVVRPNTKPASGSTVGQPFLSGTGTSQNFRIPSLITLGDGTLFAAIDARWNHQGDAGALDTIVSTSSDDGKTWDFGFANYFNDSTDAYHSTATAFIDPVTVEKNGVIYMMVDLWPGGVALNSAAHGDPINGSGYVEIDGKQRLALYASPVPSAQRGAGAENGTGYTHYVGDYGDDGFAPVISARTKVASCYVDRDYFLYGPDKEPMYCPQIGSSDYVQQNVFYYNADLHVMATSYLWLVTSSDAGKTWSHPHLLNEQVRTNVAEGNSCFYGVGPGRGLVASSGRIVLPCYTFKRGQGDGNTSVIYSDDGATWHRSESLEHQTSEATVVEADGKLYLFARHGWYAVSTDGGATWGEEKSLAQSGLKIDVGCQMDAITYSKKIDGKTAIILSCPSTVRRINGTINVGLVQDDGSISWEYAFDVTKNGNWFAYSSLTELSDGSLGILYEASDGIKYENFAIERVAKNARIGNERKLEVPLYGDMEVIVAGGLSGYESADASLIDIKVTDRGDGSSAVLLHGKREGTTTFTDEKSGVVYTVTVAPERLVEIAISPGESKIIDVVGKAVSVSPDAQVATAELATRPLSEVLGDTPASMGADNSFAGDAVALGKELMTFKKKGEGWTIAGSTRDGRSVQFKLGKKGFPGQDTAGTVELKFDEAGFVKLFDKTAGKHLHFWRDGKHAFDQCGGPNCDDDKLQLFRAAGDGEDSTGSGIPGYINVTRVADVVDGGAYLIAANVKGLYFVLNPSVDQSNKYSHVAKVDPERISSALKVTGVSVGTTDTMVGNTVYRITTAGYLDPSFAWADDYSTATATFPRNDGGDALIKECTVSKREIPATATKEGSIEYTAAVELEGKIFTDVRSVVLPAIGDPAPEKPTPGPEKPMSGKPASGAAGSGGATNGAPRPSLPATGDPMAMAGAVSIVGGAMTAFGMKARKRLGRRSAK